MSFYGLRLLDAGFGSHIVSHPDIAANHRVVADGDTAQDAGIAVDGDVVLDDGNQDECQCLSQNVPAR